LTSLLIPVPTLKDFILFGNNFHKRKISGEDAQKPLSTAKIKSRRHGVRKRGRCARHGSRICYGLPSGNRRRLRQSAPRGRETLLGLMKAHASKKGR
jgi:hypothetical protein